VLIREYKESDLDALRRMHASQGFDYLFPDLSDAIFISKLVVEDDDGRPVMASLARLTCEMYLLVDREGENDHEPRAQVEAQGFSPAKNDAPQARSTLPEAVAEAVAPKRQKIFPRERWAHLLALHRAGELDLLARGLDDAHAWLPPRIAKRFGRRLQSLGWLRDDAWTPYCKRLVP